MPSHQRLRWAAWIVLLAGLFTGGLLYILAASADPDADADLADDPQYDFTIERMGGKAAVYVAHFNRWLLSLMHGRPLAVTVAVTASALALACFWLAGMMAESLPRDAPQGRA